MTAVGIRLPTLVSQFPGRSEFARLVAGIEALGFDSAWCVDHLLAPNYLFSSAALEPVVLLSYLAGATERLRLGVSVLAAPLRHEFWLLKQLGTLSALAGDRVDLGLGAGWDHREFAVSNVARNERFRRLDALFGALTAARRDGRLASSGEEVSPPPSRFEAILMGGGSTASRETGTARLSAAVARRIARADGWLVRSSATTEMLEDDLRVIRSLRAAPDAPFRVVRATFIHVSEARDEDRAFEDQARAMATIGWRGSIAELRSAYPSGRVDSLVAWLRREAASGVSEFILHPVGDIPAQLDRIAAHVVPALRSGAARS